MCVYTFLHFFSPFQVNVGGDVTSGLFIKSIIPESPADKCGELKVGMVNRWNGSVPHSVLSLQPLTALFFVSQIGDRILAVNENSLENASHEKAVNYIKTANDRIVLVVQSLERTVREVCILLSGRTDL